jgi:hypothetical protein
MPALDHAVVLELPPAEAVGPDGNPAPVRRFPLAGMGPGVRANHVRRIKEMAWAELDRQAGMLPANRFLRLETALMQAMGAGKYEWGEEIHLSMEGTQIGFNTELLARLRAGSSTGNVHPSVVDELLKVYTTERVIALMRQADGPDDPNAPTPAPQAATGANTLTTSN